MRTNKKRFIGLLSLILIVAVCIGGVTCAYLKNQSNSLINGLSPSTVSCELNITGDDTVKESIKVQNTGSATCYVRVTLRTYWVRSDSGEVTMKSSEPLGISCSSDWISDGNNVFYYREPLTTGKKTTNLFADSFTLTLSANEEDGTSQVLEAFAGAVQALPASAAETLWSVSIDENNQITSFTTGN
jgi:hypothetical protein